MATNGSSRAASSIASFVIRSIYWGGALFALTADVRIREATNGEKSLDDVVRAVLARGGDATHVWTVRDVMRVGDEVTGTNVLSELFERNVLHGEAIDLDRLMTSLGIVRSPSGAIGFDEKSPLASIRHAIVDRSRRSEIVVAKRSSSSGEP